MSFNESKKFTFDIVLQMLKGFAELKREAAQLEFEITHYIPIATGEDMIDMMTFNKASEEGFSSVHSGQGSDKTGGIAVSYAERADRLNIRHKQELEMELRVTLADIERIEFYIGILDEKISTVLRMLYIEGLTFVEVSKKTNLSISSINRCRKTGISKLVEMFNHIAD